MSKLSTVIILSKWKYQPSLRKKDHKVVPKSNVFDLHFVGKWNLNWLGVNNVLIIGVGPVVGATGLSDYDVLVSFGSDLYWYLLFGKVYPYRFVDPS